MMPILKKIFISGLEISSSFLHIFFNILEKIQISILKFYEFRIQTGLIPSHFVEFVNAALTSSHRLLRFHLTKLSKAGKPLFPISSRLRSPSQPLVADGRRIESRRRRSPLSGHHDERLRLPHQRPGARDGRGGGGVLGDLVAPARPDHLRPSPQGIAAPRPARARPYRICPPADPCRAAPADLRRPFCSPCGVLLVSEVVLQRSAARGLD
jgi:hypothetical protein